VQECPIKLHKSEKSASVMILDLPDDTRSPAKMGLASTFSKISNS